jgi:putative transposase
MINQRYGWSGHLWQGRFSSYPMDEKHLYHAIRYVELNPVTAGLCQLPEHYRWSSARQRLDPNNPDLKVNNTGNKIVSDWQAYWQEGLMRHDLMKKFMDNEKSQKYLREDTTGTQ